MSRRREPDRPVRAYPWTAGGWGCVVATLVVVAVFVIAIWAIVKS